MADTPQPVLRVRCLSKAFHVYTGMFKSATLRAVRSVDIDIEHGRTLAVVGESGSGKTTLARLILRLIEPTSGSILLNGTELTTLYGKDLRAQRANLQMVFQESAGALSPWQSVGNSVGEPLDLHDQIGRQERDQKVIAILERVGLTASQFRRYPHQLSGGQQQRAGIARAIIANPSLVVLDEPTSSLDMSVQSQILQLLKTLQRERAFSYLFISHNLSVVRFVADDVVVMYLGQIVEKGPVSGVFDRATHPYTRALMLASPRPDPHRVSNRARLAGEQPSPMSAASGCPMYGRCPIALPICATLSQRLVRVGAEHTVACWRVAPPDDLAAALRTDVLAATATRADA